jgi:hypothetical protein
MMSTENTAIVETHSLSKKFGSGALAVDSVDLEGAFRWRSWLGASVIFFLIFGMINVISAIAVPLTLHLNGAFPGVVFSATGDPQLLGRSISGLHHDNPKLDTLLVDSMTSMCAMMMAWGIMILAAAWFGLRRGRLWTYWALLLSGLVSLVYYFVISADYARQGAAWADGLQSVLEDGIPLFLGAIAGGIALVRGLPLQQARG